MSGINSSLQRTGMAAPQKWYYQECFIQEKWLTLERMSFEYVLTYCSLRDFGDDFRCVILQHISMIDIWSISREIDLKWISMDFTDDKPILVQVMAWCCQATSHYLNWCWQSSISPYGIIMGDELTHCGLVTPYGHMEIGQHWLR